MSKVILNHIENGKELTCPICGGKEFRHVPGEFSDKHYEELGRVVVVATAGRVIKDKDRFEYFVCDCGFVATFDRIGTKVTEDVWEDGHEGAIVIEKY